MLVSLLSKAFAFEQRPAPSRCARCVQLQLPPPGRRCEEHIPPQPRTTAHTLAPPEERRQFMKNVMPSARRRKSTAVHPICFSTTESPTLLPPASSEPSQDTTPPLGDKRSSKSESRSCSSHHLKVQILHGLNLVNPCSAKSTHHEFVPTATIVISSAHLEIGQRRSSTAAKHARNHSLWRASESSLELEINQRSSATGWYSQEETGPDFSVKVSVSSVCRHRKGVAMNALQHVGDTDDISFPLKSEGYELAQFLTVWRRLGPSSALGPIEAGKIKLRVRVEAKQSAAQLGPGTREVVSAPHQKQKKPWTGRPSFLPVNFADALAMKRTQLRATVAPESVRETQDNDEQSSLCYHEHDRANSERVVQEIVRDTTLTQFSATQVEILEQIGEGVHSCVLHGRLTGAVVAGTETSSSPIDVAVKEFRYQQPFPPPKVLETFRHEYQLLEKCSREGAHHVVRYIGVLLSPRPAILTEFFASGRCVFTALASRHTLQLLVALHNHISCVSLACCIQDSASWRQVPLLKICDLGSAVVWRPYDRYLMDEVGSSGYSAPEIFNGEGYTTKVDVWSFGVVVWEMFRRQGGSSSSEKKDGVLGRGASPANPFVGLASDMFLELARNGTRPPCVFEDPSSAQLIGDLLLRCWLLEPPARPSMEQVATQLRAIIATVSVDADRERGRELTDRPIERCESALGCD
ncbi:hypothetical protein PybrP1_004906 [[Pythium] brassicae (nom. inval.)]|nr:hypothetical protein PybrP1_004906 [[Pythium] brassicae (nom. inval.)]